MSKNDFETNTAVELIKVYFSVDANSDPRIRLEGPYNMMVKAKGMQFVEPKMKGLLSPESVNSMVPVKSGYLEGRYMFYVTADKIEEAKLAVVKHVREEAKRKIKELNDEIEKLNEKCQIFEEGRYEVKDRIGEDFI